MNEYQNYSINLSRINKLCMIVLNDENDENDLL